MSELRGEAWSYEPDGRKCLFMASDVRCGSTYIAETFAYELKNAFGFELWDLAHERFADLDFETAPQRALTSMQSLFLDRSGFSASKLMCKSLSHLHRLADAAPELREAFFGDAAYWVVVRRRDRLAQAVSLAVAWTSGSFHHYGDPAVAADRDVAPSLESLDEALKAIALSDIYLQTFAASLPQDRVVSLFYEDFLEDEVGGVNRVHRMCGFPEIDARDYRHASKLVRTGQGSKAAARAQLQDWFLANYA